jgi:hypothetical protein
VHIATRENALDRQKYFTLPSANIGTCSTQNDGIKKYAAINVVKVQRKNLALIANGISVVLLFMEIRR